MMPVTKVTKTVIDKLVSLCETYESGVLGNKFSWHDLESVCGLPYQTLCKYSEINKAYKKAKKALRERSASDHVKPIYPRMPASEMEQKIHKLQEENKSLKAALEAHEQRFARWLFNAATKNIDISLLDKLIPASLDAATRKRNSLK
jgi:hypothetical protein